MPTTPEPSRVYGYISLVDPNTRQEHLVMNNNTNPPTVNGYPDFINLVFRPGAIPAGANNAQISFQGGDGIGRVGTPPRALLFNFVLVQNRAETGNPRLVDEGLRSISVPGVISCEYRAYSIHYNPDVWNFDSVAVGPYTYSDPNGTIHRGSTDNSGQFRETGRYSAIPLTWRQLTPFADLPNIT